jgi:hypothetical protein
MKKISFMIVLLTVLQGFSQAPPKPAKSKLAVIMKNMLVDWKPLDAKANAYIKNPTSVQFTTDDFDAVQRLKELTFTTFPEVPKLKNQGTDADKLKEKEGRYAFEGYLISLTIKFHETQDLIMQNQQAQVATKIKEIAELKETAHEQFRY